MAPKFASEILVGAPNFASKIIGDKYPKFCPVNFRYDPKIGTFSQLLCLVVTELPKFFLLFGELGRTLPQIFPPNLMLGPSPPTSLFGSTPLGIDPQDELQIQLLNYSKLGKIILMGDFSARKGNLLDSSVDSNNDFHLTDISEIADINVGAQTFVKMHSLDQTVNKYGRCLVNFCNSNNFSILNGRIRGDSLGKFTCYKSNGSSVIDYAISFALKTTAFQTDKECDNFLLQKPSHFIWNNEKKNLYKSILNERQTRLKCDTIIDQITQNCSSPSSIDDAVTSVTEVLHHAAIKCFVLRKYRIKKRIGQTHKNKKWFDKDWDIKEWSFICSKKPSKVSQRSYSQRQIS